MPIETIRYFLLSIASKMFLAEITEISCSADFPPNRMATRSFFFIGFVNEGRSGVEDRGPRTKNRGWWTENRSSILHLPSSYFLREPKTSSLLQPALAVR